MSYDMEFHRQLKLGQDAISTSRVFTSTLLPPHFYASSSTLLHFLFNTSFSTLLLPHFYTSPSTLLHVVCDSDQMAICRKTLMVCECCQMAHNCGQLTVDVWQNDDEEKLIIPKVQLQSNILRTPNNRKQLTHDIMTNGMQT